MNPPQAAAPVFMLGSDQMMRLQSVVSNTGALPYPELYAGTDGPNGPVFVGAGGAVVRSVGAGWERNRGNDQPAGDLHGITAGVIIETNHASFRYFAVGAGGALWHSGGGGPGRWARIPSPTSRDLLGIAFGRGRWVRAGQENLVWNGRFVAVGAETVLVSDNGLDWSVAPGLQHLLVGVTLHAVTFHAGHYVAVGSGGTILHSRDGLVWSGGPTPPGTTLRGVAYNGHTFVAVGDEGLVMQSDPIVGFDRPPRFRWESTPAEFQGRWEMSFMTEARRGYQVQATRDFLTWENVGSKFEGGGLAHVIDLANPFQDRRFYRLVADELTSAGFVKRQSSGNGSKFAPSTARLPKQREPAAVAWVYPHATTIFTPQKKSAFLKETHRQPVVPLEQTKRRPDEQAGGFVNKTKKTNNTSTDL